MTDSIIAAIDSEIATLQQARALIADASAASTPERRRPGRPKGSKNATTAAALKAKRHTMSAEGKARIAAAQKKRWAAKKRAEKREAAE